MGEEAIPVDNVNNSINVIDQVLSQLQFRLDQQEVQRQILTAWQIVKAEAQREKDSG